MVAADHFHPMRGDVFHGQQIQFSSRILTLRNTMRGWVLQDESGKQVGGVLLGATTLLWQSTKSNERKDES